VFSTSSNLRPGQCEPLSHTTNILGHTMRSFWRVHITLSSAELHHLCVCDAAEDLPPRRSIALPPEEYLAGLRTPAPELVLAEYRLRANGGAAPVAAPAPVDDVPADVAVMTVASEEQDGQQSPVSEAGARTIATLCLCTHYQWRNGRRLPRQLRAGGLMDLETWLSCAVGCRSPAGMPKPVLRLSHA